MESGPSGYRKDFMFNKKEKVHWCRGKASTKTNPMKLKRTAIGPAGQVVEVSLATGKTIDYVVGNTYAQMVEIEKVKRGWVWYAHCEDCEPVVPVGSPGAHLCDSCNERETLIRARQDAKGKSQEDYAALFETRLDKLAKALDGKLAPAAAPAAPVLTPEQMAAITAPEPAKKKGKSK